MKQLLQANPLLLTDIFWIAALLALGLFSIILIRVNLRPSAARWFSMLIYAAGCNIIGVILTDLVHHDYPIGLRGISIGRAFIPFCLLGFSLVFPYRRRLARSKTAMFALALPSMITVVVTDPVFAPGNIAYQLWYHVPWMGVYFCWAYVNLFSSFRRTRLWMTRRQHALLSMAVVPSTAMHYLTSILLPALGRDALWRYNWIPILIAFAVFLVLSVRYGITRHRTRLTRSLLDRTIDAAGLSSQMVTHAVKNSLQMIRALAETAAAADCPDRGARIDRIVFLCDELSARMNRLNLLTRAHLKLAMERFAITEPLERALERVAPRLAKVRIVREYTHPAPGVVGDQTHLEEVFCNLLTNAAEAMPRGGKLRLEIRVENDLAVVGFHDQGYGITPEQLSRIFEPFQTTKGSGTNWGIGLSYCHLVMQKMGGDLLAESVPGRGSSFFVVLPLPDHEAHHEKPLAARPGCLGRERAAGRASARPRG